MTKAPKGEGAVNIRELVLGILLEALEKEEYGNVAIHNALIKYQYLGKQDRAFLTRLSEGCIERRIQLDYVIGQFSKIKVEKMKAPIRNILRMGVYQILYMDQVPDSAACNESVKLAGKKGFGALKGFVNGVLRNISRGKGSLSFPNREASPREYLEVAYSCPRWIIDLWLLEYSMEEVEAALASFLGEKITSIRCNGAKSTAEELAKKLEAEGVAAKPGAYFPFALQIGNYNYINRIEAFRQGLFQVQDESSMAVAMAAGVKPGDKVIDVCAAPGGKATHCAELLKGKGMVHSRDLSERKVSLIQENISRLGLTNIVAEVQDALELRREDMGTADVVLADLPCSGLGVIGRKADIKYKTKEADLKALAKLQRDILAVVSQYVKPGGALIYSTCTINHFENQDNREWFLEHFDFASESLEPYLPEGLHGETAKEGYLQLLPGREKCDGFFLARFRRNGGMAGAACGQPQSGNEDRGKEQSGLRISDGKDTIRKELSNG